MLEPHGQRALLERRATSACSRPARPGARSCACGRPRARSSSSPIFFSLTSPLLGERQVQPQLGAAVRPCVSSCVSRSCRTAAGRGRRTAPSRELVQPLGADHLDAKYGACRTGTGRTPLATSLELLLLDGVPGAEVALGELVGEDAVHDHGVGQVPVQVQVGERAHRLGDDHPVGRHHQPHRHARGVAQQLVHRDEVADEPLDLGDAPSRRAAGRRGTCARAGAPPRASTAPCRAPCPATSGRRRGTRAAAASRRSARSRRRSRPTRRTPRGALSTSSENSSSPPGGTVSSSAAIRSTPRSISSAAEPLRRPRSSACSSSSWACTCWACRPLADLRRRAADRGLQDVGERMRRIGRDHERARALGRAAARRGGRDGRLARPRPCPCRGWSAAAWRTFESTGAS